MTNIIRFPESAEIAWRKALRDGGDFSNAQHLTQIAHDIFTRMTNAADALVENDSPENFQKLEEAANFLLRIKITSDDKRTIFYYLKYSGLKK